MKLSRELKLEAQEIIKTLQNSQKDDCAYGASIWDLLTALRGPDDGDIEVKQVYTGPIRKIVFGDKTWQSPGEKLGGRARKKLNAHFCRHYQCAVEAAYDIGLISKKCEMELLSRLPRLW